MKTQPYKIYSKSSPKREVHNNTGLPQEKKKRKARRKITNKWPNLEKRTSKRTNKTQSQ